MTYIHLGSFHALPLKAACVCLDWKAIYTAHRNTCDVPIAILNPHRTDSALTGRTMLSMLLLFQFPMLMSFNVTLEGTKMAKRWQAFPVLCFRSVNWDPIL